jgi:hypothetical protein
VFLARLVVGTKFVTSSPVAVGLVVAVFVVLPAVGLRHAAPRARRFAIVLGVGTCAASVAAGLAGGVPWGPLRYVHLAVLGLAALAGVGASRLHPFAALAGFAILVLGSIGHLRPGQDAWSVAALALRDQSGAVVVADPSSRIVLRHYLGRDVSVGAPPPGAASWTRATLVVDGPVRRVELTKEP